MPALVCASTAVPCRQPAILKSGATSTDWSERALWAVIAAATVAKAMLAAIVPLSGDEVYFFEEQPGYGINILCCFERICGRSVGIVANQPAVLAGSLDIDS